MTPASHEFQPTMTHILRYTLKDENDSHLKAEAYSHNVLFLILTQRLELSNIKCLFKHIVRI